ncbi:YkyB family protein [Tuberibacillus calidus]|uniref:YkyB family protein n=1 Tax=Tuberibacillus calidus TaxID=340097 RepID=UPI00138AD01A
MDAIFTVNRHAKTALKPKMLYTLKNNAIERLIYDSKAQKLGIHNSMVLVRCEEYLFHFPPTIDDIKKLPRLTYSTNHFNPNNHMPLSKAKRILREYIMMM